MLEIHVVLHNGVPNCVQALSVCTLNGIELKTILFGKHSLGQQHCSKRHASDDDHEAF